jgi:hypothetical protein
MVTRMKTQSETEYDVTFYLKGGASLTVRLLEYTRKDTVSTWIQSKTEPEQLLHINHDEVIAVVSKKVK